MDGFDTIFGGCSEEEPLRTGNIGIVKFFLLFIDFTDIDTAAESDHN